MTESKREEKQRLLRELQRNQQRDKVKLVVMVVLLGTTLGIFFMAGESKQEPPAVRDVEQIRSQISLPPVNREVLALVADGTDEDRILLEPEPYRDLLKMAQALLPAHLEVLGEPAPPFAELPARSAELRGQPFRLRGVLKAIRTLKRPPSLAEESWSWIQTEDGQDCFLAALNPPEDAFEPGDFVLADGFYFKLYSQSFDGQRVVAPLLLGRQLRKSVVEAAPVEALDFVLLAEVEDNRLGTEGELDPSGLWHLLNHAEQLAADPERRAAAFADAPMLDLAGLTELARSPELFRGKPFQIPGRVPHEPRFTGSAPAGENPVRFSRTYFGWLGNPLVFGQHPIHLVSGDYFQFTEEGARIYSGYFLQLKGYLDNQDQWRRAPVFVLVGDRVAPRGGPSIFGEFVWWFLGFACLLAGFVAWLARRDRAQAAVAARALRDRRQQRSSSRQPGS